MQMMNVAVLINKRRVHARRAPNPHESVIPRTPLSFSTLGAALGWVFKFQGKILARASWYFLPVALKTFCILPLSLWKLLRLFGSPVCGGSAG